MAKAKANKKGPNKTIRQSVKTRSTIKRRHHSQPKASNNACSLPKLKRTAQGRSSKVPFGRNDNVLLLGEGDFSFALSLLENYGPASLTATCYDGEKELVQKYPHVKDTIEKLLSGCSEPTGTQHPSGANRNAQLDEDGEWKGFPPSPKLRYSSSGSEEDEMEAGTTSQCRVFYGINAIQLSTRHRKRFQPLGPFSKIVFNFPHVGGLSTDVNRQVRANQELLVGFFKAAIPLLSTFQSSKRVGSHRYADELSDDDMSTEKTQILVTLFEGEPYTLWNIRDLARHCGLQVIESFKFPWHAYPGYQHARTAGDIASGKDKASNGKRGGAWRGEERDARCYILQTGDSGNSQASGNNARKRGRPDEASVEDSP